MRGEPDVTSYACDVVLLTERPHAHEALMDVLASRASARYVN